MAIRALSDGERECWRIMARGPGSTETSRRPLRCSKETIRRLAYDRRYFARPARSLFNSVRMHFAIGDQLRVWMVIDRNIKLAQAFLDRMPERLGLDGVPRQCQAHTRRGTPCQREPLPARDYCPSHKHLEETFDGPELPVEALTKDYGLEEVAAQT